MSTNNNNTRRMQTTATTQDEYKQQQQQHKTSTNNNKTRRIQTTTATTQDEYKQQQQHKTSTNNNNSITMHKQNKEVNKTWALQQTTDSKDEPNIVCIRQSERSSQHGIQNVKEHSKQVINLQYSSVNAHSTSSIIQPSSFISIFFFLHLRFFFFLLCTSWNQ